jgi:radical SAM superfamily enzyme YgiQ (UPF0313 family)
MKVSLLNIESKRKECINKDFMGGYGWAFNAGVSFPARLINFVKKRGEKLPIMSFGYLAAIFSNSGHKVTIDTNMVPDADLVILSSSMVDYGYEIEWARRIKKNGITVGFIGPFAWYNPELFLNDCDFIVKGEPEGAAMDMASGKILSGVIESRPVEDLDSLPFPKWDIFPFKSYTYIPALKEKPFLPLLSSRGCLYQCGYCPYVVAYKFRRRSPNNVFSEISYLKDRFQIKGMVFRDPLFGNNKDFVRQLCGMILEKNIKIKWACETRMDLLDKEMLDIMYKAGLRVINTGIESSDPGIIKKATRVPVKKEHQEEIVRYCDKLGIRVTAFYMFGLPDDTYESINTTIKYAKYLNTHVAQFFIHTPFPGTKYFEAVKDNIIENDWCKFDCYNPVLRHKNLTKEQILALKEKAFVSYYYRLGYIGKFISRSFKDFTS